MKINETETYTRNLGQALTQTQYKIISSIIRDITEVDLLQRRLHITRKDKLHDNAVARQKKTKCNSTVLPNVPFMR